ncbi:unnamed protein product [Adineta steineri]|uniref:PDZ domain-containing protein n=1 Tax=Adineta steineri TaxID=433720 RepID=A0A814P0K9_9BILA|nr:unnamed protein product [Adineta steineri]
MNGIIYERDEFYQSIIDETEGTMQCSAIKEINKWKQKSINKIQQIAGNNLQKLYFQTVVQKLTEELRKAGDDDSFIEIDITRWLNTINNLKTSRNNNLSRSFNDNDKDLIDFTSDIENQTNKQRINFGYVGEECEQIFNFTLDYDHSHLRIIELRKTTECLGFHIRGGRDEKSPIYISRIIPNSVAWTHGGLKKGDKLLFVNDKSLDNLCRDEAIQLLKQTQESVILLVQPS